VGFLLSSGRAIRPLLLIRFPAGPFVAFTILHLLRGQKNERNLDNPPSGAFDHDRSFLIQYRPGILLSCTPGAVRPASVTTPLHDQRSESAHFRQIASPIGAVDCSVPVSLNRPAGPIDQPPRLALHGELLRTDFESAPVYPRPRYECDAEEMPPILRLLALLTVSPSTPLRLARLRGQIITRIAVILLRIALDEDVLGVTGR